MPPRRRLVEIDNRKLDEAAKAGELSVPEPKLGQANEYGLSSFITAHCGELTDNLKATLPAAWSHILAMAYCRLRNQSPNYGLILKAI